MIEEGYTDLRKQLIRYTNLINDSYLDKRLLEISVFYINSALKAKLENEGRKNQRNNIRNLHAKKKKAETAYFDRIAELLMKKKLNQTGLPKCIRVQTT